jgi:hypothetical protein
MEEPFLGLASDRRHAEEIGRRATGDEERGHFVRPGE